MFELLAAILENNEITIYSIQQFPTINECVVASVQLAQQITNHTATFVCARSV